MMWIILIIWNQTGLRKTIIYFVYSLPPLRGIVVVPVASEGCEFDSQSSYICVYLGPYLGLVGYQVYYKYTNIVIFDKFFVLCLSLLLEDRRDSSFYLY